MWKFRTAFEELSLQSVRTATLEEVLGRREKGLEVEGHQLNIY